MRIESRSFLVNHETGERRHMLCLIAENETESLQIDNCFGNHVKGDGLISSVKGEVRLSDGCAEHYLLLEKGK